MSRANKNIPRWIMIYGYIQILMVIGFSTLSFTNAHPTEASNLNWYVGARNLAILLIFLIALIREDVKYLFASYFIKFCVDTKGSVV